VSGTIGLEIRFGTVGLAAAGRQGSRFLAKIKPELDRLIAVRFFMDEELYGRALVEAGE
jgi:predicted nucleic acid-binding protein